MSVQVMAPSANPAVAEKANQPKLQINTASLSSTASATTEEKQPKPAHNFIIPKIIITQPMNGPRYSEPVPEQKYDKAVLFVPVKTEELGWDDNGLYWNGTYAYPVHNIYNKEGRAIGRRRNGPEGYRFVEMFDTVNSKQQPLSLAFDNEEDEATEDLIMEEGEIDDPYMANNAEEARFNLAEPAPAVVDDDVTECASPTLICTADSDTETMDGTQSSACSDVPSLWSRRSSDDSVCSTPGTATPPSSEDTTKGIDGTLLANRLESSTKSPFSQGWTHLGSIPRRHPGELMSKQRSSTLPVTPSSSSSSPPTTSAHDFSSCHRSVSSPSYSALDEQRHADPAPPPPRPASPPTPQFEPTFLQKPVMQSSSLGHAHSRNKQTHYSFEDEYSAGWAFEQAF